MFPGVSPSCIADFALATIDCAGRIAAIRVRESLKLEEADGERRDSSVIDEVIRVDK